jgi:hypothetical protein
VPVKRVQSSEFYGADALPKPARKGGRVEGTARTLGRGVSEGGISGPYYMGPCFPFATISRWSNGHKPDDIYSFEFPFLDGENVELLLARLKKGYYKNKIK